MKTEVIISEKEKLAQTRARLEKRQKVINKMERKVRLKKIIELGDLVVRSGLDGLDSDLLLGAFLEIKELSTNKGTVKKWAEKRESWLKLQHSQRLIISFRSELSEESKNILKSKKFKWNTYRQEWYGLGRLDEMKALLEKDNAEISEVTE